MNSTTECELLEDHVGSYVDGSLAGEIACALDGHLLVCETCRNNVKRFRAVKGLLQYVKVESDATTLRVAPAAATLPVHGWKDRFGAAPWWFVSLSMHVLLIALASLISMSIELPRDDDAIVMITELQARAAPAEEARKEKADRTDVLQTKETPATDLSSKENSEIVVPPNILAQAELGDHFETINPELPNTSSALGNPESKSFHSFEGDAGAVGGGGTDGMGMDDLIGFGGAASKGSGGGFGGGDGTGIGIGKGAGKGSFGNRNGGGRRAMVKKHGGSRVTEGAVDSALRWLAYHQEADGHWEISKYGATEWESCPAAHNEGMSALALLAFLGAGHTEKIGEYHDNVARAAKWIMTRQNPDGSFIPRDGYGMYDTALCSLALAELCGMTRDYDLKQQTSDAAEKGIDWLYKWQQANTNGGWYHGIYGRCCSMSLTGWVIMAMKSAKVAKLKVPADMFAKAIVCLENCSDKDESGYYTRTRYTEEPNPRPASDVFHKARTTSAIGMVCFEFCGMGNQAEQIADYVSEVPPSWAAPGVSQCTDPQNFYHWYYATLGMFQHGGEKWKKWNEALIATLVPAQCKDGDNAGSWPAERAWEPTGGRVFTTAMGALCLEVYYRYAKLSQ